MLVFSKRHASIDGNYTVDDMKLDADVRGQTMNPTDFSDFSSRATAITGFDWKILDN